MQLLDKSLGNAESLLTQQHCRKETR